MWRMQSPYDPLSSVSRQFVIEHFALESRVFANRLIARYRQE